MHLSLRQKIFALITSMGLITVAWGGAILWYTVYIQDSVSTIVQQEVKAYKAAKEMQGALSNQKGFLTYYFLDSDPKWLQELGTYRQMFWSAFQQASELAKSQEQTELFARLAHKLDLLTSGGSDFHGRIKPDIRLGEGRGDLILPYSLVQKMKTARRRQGLWV